MPSDQLAERRSWPMARAAKPEIGPAARVSVRQVRALHFTAAMLFCVLVLQRFGVPLGSKPFSLVGAVGIALAGFALLAGTLALHRIRLGLFLALAACAVAGLLWHALRPTGFAAAPNFASLAQFLLLTGFATLSFAQKVDEQRFFRVVNFWFAIIAVAGIGEFVAQFFGLRLFSFVGLVPQSLLFEFGYNVQIPLGVGDLLKSNGFFLVEPSVFSQVMALALIIEILAFRRLVFLALFATGLLLSFSGTGWIVLASFIVAAAIGMGWRGMALAGAMLLLLGVLAGGAALVAPDIATSVSQRAAEFSHPGTSGHRRFVTPFWALDDALTTEPSAALVGLGSGVSERLQLPYDYDVNTPIKVALDYGFPALLAYVLLFVVARRSPVQIGLAVPALVMYFFTGAYQEFPPLIFLVLLLITVARLQPAKAAAVAR